MPDFTPEEYSSAILPNSSETFPHVAEYDSITGGFPANQSNMSFNGCTCSIRNDAADDISVPNGSIAMAAASAANPTMPSPAWTQLPSLIPLNVSIADSAMEIPVIQPLSPVPALNNPPGSASGLTTRSFGPVTAHPRATRIRARHHVQPWRSPPQSVRQAIPPRLTQKEYDRFRNAVGQPGRSNAPDCPQWTNGTSQRRPDGRLPALMTSTCSAVNGGSSRSPRWA